MAVLADDAESDRTAAARSLLRAENPEPLLFREWLLSGSHLQKTGIYLFVISFACFFYLLNARILLGHYDLGWHLAAGDLIRSQGKSLSTIPGRSPLVTSAGSTCPGFGMCWPARYFNMRISAG